MLARSDPAQATLEARNLVVRDRARPSPSQTRPFRGPRPGRPDTARSTSAPDHAVETHESSLGRGTGGGEVVTGMTTEALVQAPTLKQHLTAILKQIYGKSVIHDPKQRVSSSKTRALRTPHIRMLSLYVKARPATSTGNFIFCLDADLLLNVALEACTGLKQGSVTAYRKDVRKVHRSADCCCVGASALKPYVVDLHVTKVAEAMCALASLSAPHSLQQSAILVQTCPLRFSMVSSWISCHTLLRKRLSRPLSGPGPRQLTPARVRVMTTSRGISLPLRLKSILLLPQEPTCTASRLRRRDCLPRS